MAYRYFQLVKDYYDASYTLVYIGRIYRFLKDNRKALENYRKAISLIKDSFLYGLAFQEIGINYYKSKSYDSSLFYLKKSLKFPYTGTSYAVRCTFLGDVYYDILQYDSAFYYAKLSLKYPSTFFNQRDSYRILANSEYNKHNFAKAEFYMVKYQECTDSVRQIEIQTKSTVLEDIHVTKGAFDKSKHSLIILIGITMLIVVTSVYLFFQLRNRNKRKEIQLENVEKKLINKQALLKESLIKKIEENKLIKSAAYKKATIAERELIDKGIYTFCLHLDNWNSYNFV